MSERTIRLHNSTSNEWQARVDRNEHADPEDLYNRDDRTRDEPKRDETKRDECDQKHQWPKARRVWQKRDEIT